MELHQDYKEFCSWLNARSVEYLIVGGYAVAFHGAPRFTGGLDLSGGAPVRVGEDKVSPA